MKRQNIRTLFTNLSWWNSEILAKYRNNYETNWREGKCCLVWLWIQRGRIVLNMLHRWLFCRCTIRARWIDPLAWPESGAANDNRDVLVKTTLCREYCIAFYKANGGRNHHWHENNGSLDDDMVIGWRPILEKSKIWQKHLWKPNFWSGYERRLYWIITITGYARFVGGCGINQNVEFYAVLRSMGVYSVARWIHPPPRCGVKRKEKITQL